MLPDTMAQLRRLTEEPVHPAGDTFDAAFIGLVPECVAECLHGVLAGHGVPAPVQFGVELTQRQGTPPAQDLATPGTQTTTPEERDVVADGWERRAAVWCGPSTELGEVDPETAVECPSFEVQRLTFSGEAAELLVEQLETAADLGVLVLELLALPAEHRGVLRDGIDSTLVHGCQPRGGDCC
jgi:hypothetical protein